MLLTIGGGEGNALTLTGETEKGEQLQAKSCIFRASRADSDTPEKIIRRKSTYADLNPPIL